MKQAKWIWAHKEDHPDEYAHFYQKFTASEKPIRLDISCDGNYELYINGKLAGFGQYADYPHAKVFDRINVSSFCHAGENTFSLLCWHLGADCFTYWKGEPGVIFELTQEEKVVASSGMQTLCRIAPDYVSGRQKQITDQMGFSYTWDSRGYNGWQTRGFVPTSYGYAVELSERGNLIPRPNQKLTLRPYEAATLIGREPKIYDLGKESVGYLHLRFRAPVGAEISVSWGEHLVRTEDGTEQVPRIIGKRDFSVDLIGNGEWVDFSNHMRRLGCRYLQVSGEAEVETVGLEPAEYPVTVLPFSADTPLRRKIYDTCVNTLRLCMFEHYEDCPWREQSLYHLDSRNQMLCGYAAFGEYEFARSSLWLFGQDRSRTGLLHICAPSQKELYIPFFSLMYFLQMEEYARYSGDASLIELYYDKLQSVLRVFQERKEDGLIVNFYEDPIYWNFYEWNETLDGHNGREKRLDLVLNCATSLAFRRMSDMAKRIGKDRDSDTYRAEAECLNCRIHETFYSERDGLYQTVAGKSWFSRVGNAFAVLCGAAKGDVAKTVCRRMLEEKTVIPATLSMRGFVYDALLSVDEKRYTPWILEEIDRDYGYMLQCGATSFWETIDGAEAFGNAGSLCHGWSAIPILYYRRLLPSAEDTIS